MWLITTSRRLLRERWSEVSLPSEITAQDLSGRHVGRNAWVPSKNVGGIIDIIFVTAEHITLEFRNARALLLDFDEPVVIGVTAIQ